MMDDFIKFSLSILGGAALCLVCWCIIKGTFKFFESNRRRSNLAKEIVHLQKKFRRIVENARYSSSHIFNDLLYIKHSTHFDSRYSKDEIDRMFWAATLRVYGVRLGCREKSPYLAPAFLSYIEKNYPDVGMIVKRMGNDHEDFLKQNPDRGPSLELDTCTFNLTWIYGELFGKQSTFDITLLRELSQRMCDKLIRTPFDEA